jgi:hypothetical protein
MYQQFRGRSFTAPLKTPPTLIFLLQGGGVAEFVPTQTEDTVGESAYLRNPQPLCAEGKLTAIAKCEDLMETATELVDAETRIDATVKG